MDGIIKLFDELFRTISHINIYVISFGGLVFILGYLWASYKAGTLSAKNELIAILQKEIISLKKQNERYILEHNGLRDENQRLQRMLVTLEKMMKGVSSK
jgi:AAA+ ATPase superfamily predicted ATPase